MQNPTRRRRRRRKMHRTTTESPSEDKSWDAAGSLFHFPEFSSFTSDDSSVAAPTLEPESTFATALVEAQQTSSGEDNRPRSEQERGFTERKIDSNTSMRMKLMDRWSCYSTTFFTFFLHCFKRHYSFKFLLDMNNINDYN